MTSIKLNEKERKDIIRQMKRETKPSRRLRMHIVLLVADELKPAEIAAVLTAQLLKERGVKVCTETVRLTAVIAKAA